MDIFVNRILNLKQVKMIGFDMDHTLVQYNSEAFEEMAFREMIRKLRTLKNYPAEIEDFQFEFKRVVRGLVFDIKRGNILKLNLYGRAKSGQHGGKNLDFQLMKETYKELVIDLSESDYASIDTTFSISIGWLYSLLVDFRDRKVEEGYPFQLSYQTIFKDIIEVIDLSHQDDSLKGEVRKNVKKFVEIDPRTVKALEKFKKSGKILSIITNSDFHYCKLLLDYAINDQLGKGKHWLDLFDYVITLAEKPAFFYQNRKFLKVNPEDGTMINWKEPLVPGIYQGGCAQEFSKQLGLTGSEILYLGDHIFGDIVKLKKSCNWRTALVLDDLVDEIQAHKKGAILQREIDKLMEQKEELEGEYSRANKTEAKEIIEKIKKVDEKVRERIVKCDSYYNPHWGSIMRAGQEESYFAGQVERYACIYMAGVGDLNDASVRHYFRPRRRRLPHETY